ncbi:hypothetical protein Q7A53_05250 [Halobacillus rhizosphaerae]|uniref:hypothetical protein n=1 Tax=Halobacillus rhizosphaerae TaxID=3064889 RepID=UPI00398A5D5E
MRENLNYIGNGNYLVFYEEYVGGKNRQFVGKCENFNPSGLSAFWNEESEQMLLVGYREIMAMYPLEEVK